MLDQLAAAFTNTQRAQSTVTRVTIGAENHHSPTGHHFAHVLVNDGQMWRYIDAAVLLRRRKGKGVIVGIYGASHCGKAVMAICQHIRQGELVQPTCPRCLDNADVCNVV
ncbi:MAG: hypothetical protein DDT38_01416 [Firmicutes bacterium]|nr:hypothetical protein [candidate division NPL-UPA2 bacterium]